MRGDHAVDTQQRRLDDAGAGGAVKPRQAQLRHGLPLVAVPLPAGEARQLVGIVEHVRGTGTARRGGEDGVVGGDGRRHAAANLGCVADAEA